MKHMRIGLSRAARIVQCPASLQHEERLLPIERDISAADRGTAFHELAAVALSNGGDVCAEIKDYIDDISLIQSMCPGAKLHIEEFISSTHLHPENGGTPDAWLADIESDILYVWDLKTGYKEVDAFMNWQLINAASAILRHPECNLSDSASVVMTIVQTNCYTASDTVRRHVVTFEDIRRWSNHLALRFINATSDNPKFGVGSECTYCNFRHYCPELKSRCAAIVEELSHDHKPSDTLESKGQELNVLTEYTKLIGIRLSALREVAISDIESGKTVPGWCAEATLSDRFWLNEPDEIIEMGKELGVDLQAPITAVSPAQAESKGIPKDLISGLTGRKNTGFKLKQLKNRGVS